MAALLLPDFGCPIRRGGRFPRMIPKSGNRFSDKIMRKQDGF
jgi:hypothetical protein